MCHRFLPVWSVSLGCPKNRVDTERLLGSLGFPIKIAAAPGKSKLALINTCAFIEPAVRESIRAILDIIKKSSRLKTPPLIAVAGCLPGRYGTAELAKEFPEVDLWLEPSFQPEWPAKIAEAMKRERKPGEGRLLSTGPSYAWLKISDGCDHRCSFCVIPNIRGGFKPEPVAKIVAEARELLARGVKELVLVGQDVSAWRGDSSSPEKNFTDLLKTLARLDGLEWLRMLYLYPAAVTESFIRAVADIGRPLLPYFDIPLQHSQEKILKRMGRPFVVDARRIVGRIREKIPDVALRTSLIVGFPGETDADFRALLNFVRETRFQNLGVFVYRPEEGTPAANFPDQVPEETKETRKAELLEEQAKISAEYLASVVGGTMDALVDESDAGEWPGLYKGRVWFQAPEIDGITYISGPGVKAGAFLPAEIVGSVTYDLNALA
ncbi:MAG: 30S ribosomal protein S12 methylthiotransferase RimO [Desulfovibrio sp.]|nr:30S ribosomal protein S12 methylthiotransferase RimO [Desulfovibrio sp.]